MASIEQLFLSTREMAFDKHLVALILAEDQPLSPNVARTHESSVEFYDVHRSTNKPSFEGAFRAR